MATDGKELVQKGIESEGEIKPVTFNKKLNDWVVKHKQSLESSFGSDSKRFVRTIYNVCKFSPELLKVDFNSLTDCILQSLELSLYPGPVFQECAYVPRKIKGVYMACFEPMYKGIVKVATNAGLKEATTDIIYSSDEFVYTSAKFLHVPNWRVSGEARGERIGAWARVKTVHGGYQLEVMNMDQIYAHRDKGAAAKYKSGPWFDPLFEEGMIRKTVLKKALKYVSKSPQLSRIINLDDRSEMPEIEDESEMKGLPLALPEGFDEEE